MRCQAPFGTYLLTLLTGQRRTETVLMRWADVDLEAGVWSIPAAVTKARRAHKVPLLAVSKRLRAVYAGTAAAEIEPRA